MSGVVCGLRLAEALASVPAMLDLELCRRLFIVAEASFLSAAWEKAQESKTE